MSKPVVLYVDDMVPNINVFRISFKRYFQILTAENAEEALEAIKNNEVDVVITDQRMPGMTGIELLAEVNKLKPQIAKMIISEYSKDSIIRESMQEHNILHNFHKPWDREDVMAKVIAAVN